MPGKRVRTSKRIVAGHQPVREVDPQFASDQVGLHHELGDERDEDLAVGASDGEDVVGPGGE
jgi:hypothetical protein